MRWLIIRHGTTVANAAKRFSGQTDVALTEKGEKETENAVKDVLQRLESYSKEEVMIFASPLQRARIMAEKLHKKSNWELTILEDLMEFHLGDFEGRNMEEIERDYPFEYKEWMEDYRAFTFPGGEAYRDFEDRVKKGLSTITQEINKKKVLPKAVVVISHGGVSDVLLRELSNGELEGGLLDNGEIREIQK